MALRVPMSSFSANALRRARTIARSQQAPQSAYPHSQLPKRPVVHQPTYYPGIEEEEGVSHAAFHSAFEKAKPEQMRVAGLQQFAAAIWDRRRRIPSLSNDPLMHLFTEFDADNDGVLNPDDIAQAFSSHGVTISSKQVQALIEAFEEGREHVIKREEFPDFVYSLAVSDLHAKGTHVPGRSLDSFDS